MSGRPTDRISAAGIVGGWSAADPAKILLPREVRGRFRLVLVSNVRKEPRALQVQMDNSIKTIVLRAEQNTFQAGLRPTIPCPDDCIARNNAEVTFAARHLGRYPALRFYDRQAGMREREEQPVELS